MAPKKVYVVFEGRQRGIFEDWVDCHNATNGFRGNCFKSFSSHEEAEQAWLAYKNKEDSRIETKKEDSKKTLSPNLKNLNQQFDPPLPPQSPLRWFKKR
jgi:ribonuclease HI